MKDKPLSERSDSYLIRMVKNECSSEAFQEICNRYEDLFYKICRKYSSSLSSHGIYIVDIFNEKNMIILHCIKTFKPSKKTKLSSWIGNYARYLCLNSMNARRLILPVSDSDIQKKIEEQQVCQNYFEPKKNLESGRNLIFELLSKMKDKRIEEIFRYRYLDRKKMIWQNIAKKMNTSPQTVMSLHRKGIVLIKNKIPTEEKLYDLL